MPHRAFPICLYREAMRLLFSAHAVRKVGVDTMPEYLMTLYHLTLQSAYMQYHRCTVLPERLAMMLVREWRQATRYYPEACYDVGQSGGRPHGTYPRGWL